MSNEELNGQIQEIVDMIEAQQFAGTEEEIKIQQILYFDKYVKDNIDYGFEAANFLLQHPNEKNPFDSAFRLEGFFQRNEINGKRLAVCGSISQAAKTILNKLGIKCDYVWGHFNIGTNSEPQYLGHRWNVVTVGDKNYMVDFTIGMIIHNLNKDYNYTNAAKQLLALNDESREYDYLFFDKLAPAQSIGGFKKNKNGTPVDDLDEFGNIKNSTTEPQKVISNLGTISQSNIIEYIKMFDRGRVL